MKLIRSHGRVGHRTTRSCQRTARAITSCTIRSITTAEMPISRMPAQTSSIRKKFWRVGHHRAEATVGRDQLGGHDGGPADAEGDPDGDEDLRHREGYDDPAEQLELGGAERTSRTDVEVVDRRDALVDHDHRGEERRVDEQREARRLADAELDDHQWDQRQRRQRAEEADQRVEHVAHDREPRRARTRRARRPCSRSRSRSARAAR